MLSSPLLPLYLIILLSTLIFFDSSARGKKKYQNLKVQPESEEFWQLVLSGVIFPFFPDQFDPLQKKSILHTKQTVIDHACKSFNETL